MNPEQSRAMRRLTRGAAATVAVLIAVGIGFRDFISWPKLSRRLGIAILGSGAFAFLFLALPGVSVFLLMPLAVVIYAAIVACFREVREEELSALIELLRKRPAAPSEADAE